MEALQAYTAARHASLVAIKKRMHAWRHVGKHGGRPAAVRGLGDMRWRSEYSSAWESSTMIVVLHVSPEQSGAIA
eukprot:3245758-Rhodomonas_salina.1